MHKNIVVIDTEYLSLRKKYSNYEYLIKFKKKLFPEIIQIAACKFDIYNKKKFQKLNIYFKIQQKIPTRIKKLTGINETILKKKGKNFKENFKKLIQFIKKNDIVFVNGQDLDLIKFNMKYLKIKNIRKSFFYLNLKKLTGNIDTNFLQRDIKLDKKKLHNASYDCTLISNFIRKIVKFYSYDFLNYIVSQNKKNFKF